MVRDSNPPGKAGFPGYQLLVGSRRFNYCGSPAALAIVSLVLDLLGVKLLGLNFGFEALGQIKSSGPDVRGFAIAGIILSLLWIGVVIAVFVAASVDLTVSGVTAAIGFAYGLDPTLFDCYHGNLTRGDRLVVPLLAQLAAASNRSPREPASTNEVAATTPQGVQVPVAVLATAREIHTAASRQDLGSLRALATAPDFTFTFGDPPGDPGPFWSADPDGSTSSMVTMLERSVETDGSLWWWPAEWVTDDSYFGFRIGIYGQGVWRYAVAGD